jgi:hypothetical protein
LQWPPNNSEILLKITLSGKLHLLDSHLAVALKVVSRAACDPENSSKSGYDIFKVEN